MSELKMLPYTLILTTILLSWPRNGRTLNENRMYWNFVYFVYLQFKIEYIFFIKFNKKKTFNISKKYINSFCDLYSEQQVHKRVSKYNKYVNIQDLSLKIIYTSYINT